ncbi:universal stress protein [Deinococcus aetherius]|nr:universal stress protein [Deinococcus aetherius]
MTDRLIFTAGTGTEATETQATPGPSSSSFGRILVGIDFSRASEHALGVVRERFPGAQLLLLHVTDARVTATPDLGGGLVPALPDPGLLHTLEDSDASRLARLVREGDETEQLVGDPVTGILEAARSWGADLIAVGTHARGAIEHFLVGSTAEKIVARSPVPVLTVRLPEGRR